MANNNNNNSQPAQSTANPKPATSPSVLKALKISITVLGFGLIATVVAFAFVQRSKGLDLVDHLNRNPNRLHFYYLRSGPFTLSIVTACVQTLIYIISNVKGVWPEFRNSALITYAVLMGIGAALNIVLLVSGRSSFYSDMEDVEYEWMEDTLKTNHRVIMSFMITLVVLSCILYYLKPEEMYEFQVVKLGGDSYVQQFHPQPFYQHPQPSYPYQPPPVYQNQQPFYPNQQPIYQNQQPVFQNPAPFYQNQQPVYPNQPPVYQNYNNPTYQSHGSSSV